MNENKEIKLVCNECSKYLNQENVVALCSHCYEELKSEEKKEKINPLIQKKMLKIKATINLFSNDKNKIISAIKNSGLSIFEKFGLYKEVYEKKILNDNDILFLLSESDMDPFNKKAKEILKQISSIDKQNLKIKKEKERLENQLKKWVIK